MTRRHAIDTNLYIDALRTAEGLAGLSAFQSAYAPFIVLSAVVAQELRAGASGRSAGLLEASIIAPFERRNRLITPSFRAWKESGRVLSAIVGKGDWASVPRSFVNDVLLAASCREAGVVLVTRNTRDCKRIAKAMPFEFVEPWPGMSA